jgi:hypothetical protein
LGNSQNTAQFSLILTCTVQAKSAADHCSAFVYWHWSSFACAASSEQSQTLTVIRVAASAGTCATIGFALSR